MIINKIQLQNITTHRNTMIEFSNGVNILMGNNGTGKSTVLTMIGYVLFDYLPGNKDIYVRNTSKQRYGTIKIWIIGNDNKQYCIERRIGKKSNKIIVLQGESETKLQNIDSVHNLREWLKSIIGIQDFSLSSIFENAIGVKQGTFTAPFLMRPSDRKKIFAPLLNVEVYDQVFTKYRKINKFFEKKLGSIKNQINRLEGELEQQSELLKEKNELEEFIDVNNGKLNQFSKEFKKIKQKYDEMNKIKKNLEKIKNMCEKYQIEITNSEKNIHKIKSNLFEAKGAKDICEKTKGEYLKYNKYSEEQRKLQKKFKEFQEIKEKINQLKQEFEKKNSKLEETQKNIRDIEKDKKILPELEKSYIKYQDIKEKITKIRKKITEIETNERLLKKQKIKKTKIKKKMKNLQRALNKKPHLKKEIEIIEEQTKESTKLQISIGNIKVRIEDLEKNIEESKDGICPLCKQEYKVEGKSLEESFKDELIQKKLQFKENNEEIIKLKEKTKLLDDKKQDLDTLKNKNVEFKEYIKQIKEINKDITNFNEVIKKKKELSYLLEGNIKKEQDLEEIAKKYHVLNEKIKIQFPKYKKDSKIYKKQILIINNKINPFRKRRMKLDFIPGKLDDIREILKKTKNHHDEYQSNFSLVKKLETYEKELQNEIKKLKEYKNNLKNEQSSKKKLQLKFNEEEFKKVEEKKSSTNDEIIRLKEELSLKSQILISNKKKLKNLKEKEKKLKKSNKNYEKVEGIDAFSHTIRTWFKEAAPKITAALMEEINETASNIYRKIKDEESILLEWQKDYDVHVKTAKDPCRIFDQLSGGEQMAVALSIRLAVLKVLTKIDFAFFDEPTTNLDSDRRYNLANCIQNIPGFKQLFIISHDDTFEESSDHVIKFSKNKEEETIVEFLSQKL